jgi:hypothetical protein
VKHFLEIARALIERPIVTGVGFEKAIKVRKKLVAADAETAQAIGAVALAVAARRATKVLPRLVFAALGSIHPKSNSRRYVMV